MTLKQGVIRTTKQHVPPGLPENKLYKFVMYVKRQSKPVRVLVLAVCVVIIVGFITLVYASFFQKHLTGDHTGQAPSTQTKVSKVTRKNGSSVPPSPSTKTTASASTAPSSNTTSTKSNSGSSTPSSGAPATSSGDVLPSSILNLTDWKLTLPTGSTDNPTEISQPQLASFALAPYFNVDNAHDGVTFQAQVGGVTTSGSDFPRSELREMTNNGQNEASWSTTSGNSTMTLRESINHLPAVRNQVVAAQIHGPSAYVILIRLNGNQLFVEYNGNNAGTLDGNYQLGTTYNLQITASGGKISVWYNGALKANFANSSSGDYFKAGDYTQSNPSYGDSSTDYGQTTIYSLNVSHS